ncbi:MAG TPA: hypothetical protein VG650_07550 [Mycobacteriales bacterium]|nr:hypothetical protein [Mycobacteriales bacterium]
MSNDLENLLQDAMKTETADVMLAPDALPRAFRSVRRRRIAVAATSVVGVLGIGIAGGVVAAGTRHHSPQSVRIAGRYTGKSLPLTASVRKDLIAAFASAQHIQVSDVAGFEKGSAHYGRIDQTRTYWAVASFVPSRSASAQAKVQFQDGPFVFSELPAGGWSAWGLLTDSGGGLCPSEVPAALAQAWAMSEPSDCRPGPAAYAAYRSGRFGFTVHVPASFVPDAPPTDGDALVFQSADGRATMTAGGDLNVHQVTPGQMVIQLRHMYQIQGTEVTRHGRVVTARGTTASGQTFVDREFVYSTNIYYVKWTYPAAERATYGPMVTEAVASFYLGANPS